LETLPNEIELIVNIETYSFYYFLSLVFILIISVFLLFKLGKWFWNNRTNERKDILQILHNIDWQNPKETAYKITKLGNKISETRSQRLLDDLIIELEKYKYRRDSEEISNDVKAKFQIFLGVVENE